jgi:D-alanine transaminase
MSELAYVNGEFCALADAKVSIEDRGFQFADGVYEVVVAHGGRPFRLDEHLTRLAKSLGSIGLAFDFRQHRIQEVILEGIARTGFDRTLVYLQITRGAAPRSHVVPPETQPTVVMTFKPLPPPSAELRANGVAVRTTEETRWTRCHIKSTSLLPNVMAKNAAVRDGCFDAIFVTPEGEVREATAANVFVVKDGEMRTPPKSQFILHGVTRAFILECAAEAGVPAREIRITLEDLKGADEMFISSSTMDILPVTRLNDQPVGDGRVGPETKKLQEQFRRSVEAELAGGGA